MSDQSTIHTSADFEAALDLLNEAQRQAVYKIEGPVMVLAGPGTGKTQILALRIGNILKSTDTRPGHILCLTYTDAGAVAMRSRLLRFIGPDAYKVQVHTFHSFCNQVIQDNQEYFSDYATLQHVSDLEKAQMLRKLIDRFPFDHPLRRLKGNLYYEAQRLDGLFSLMKRESWEPDMLMQAIQQEFRSIEEDPSLFYKRATATNQVGDPKATYFKSKYQMELLQAAVEAFEPFQEMMHEAGRYDFDDMIHWVRNAFSREEGLKAMYQERFLYMLVDEYQDTNGAQNEIIHLLCDFWERPNLFVVGDDDQAIFRFQGANISNLIQLYHRYDPAVIILTDNYRSTQPILDSAGALIKHNQERITSEIPDVVKILKARGTFRTATPKPKIYQYLNVIQEETALFETLCSLHRSGARLDEIAVIYRKHSQATNLIKALGQKNIPVDVKQRVNILHEPLVQNLEKIMTFLLREFEQPGTAEPLLFELMHYRFFDLPPVDVAKISMYCWKDDRDRKQLRQVISDFDILESLQLADMDRFIRFGALIDELISIIPHVTLQVLFERILKRANVFREVMGSEQRTYLMQVVATFFNHLKAECQRDPQLDLSLFLETLGQMRDIGLPLPMHNLMRAKDGINFMTAHGAKGLEFKHVFLLSCNRHNWEKIRGRRNDYRLPSRIVDPSGDHDEEDERRLFYVAMTRAKENLVISYAAEKLNGMPEEPSKFVTEVMQGGDIKEMEKPVLPEETISYYQQLLTPADRKLPLIDHELIDKALEKFAMSPTALNKYLQCPRSFYFENILRVPLANSPFLGFGNAVHNALQRLIEDHNRGLEMQTERLLAHFRTQMQHFQAHFTQREYENYLQHGQQVLTSYYQKKITLWLNASKLIPEKNISHIIHRGVPIKGRIDLILQDQQGEMLVMDFKTGSTDSGKLRSKLEVPSKHEDLGGDYWRQVVFYKILLDELKEPGLRMDKGLMSFVEPNRYGDFKEEDYLVDMVQEGIVSDQMVEVYKQMRAHHFDVDCGRKACDWCAFVKNDFVLPDDTFEEAPEPPDEFDEGDQGQMQLMF